MTTNDRNAFDRSSDNHRAGGEDDRNAFGAAGVLVCTPANTGNHRNQTAYIEEISPPPGPPTPRARFQFIDSNTDAPAHLMAPTGRQVSVVQHDQAGNPGPYNYEHWADYPTGDLNRWDINLVGIDLGRTQPVTDVLHLAGTLGADAASCPGYSDFILDYLEELDVPWVDGVSCEIAKFNTPDADQRHLSTLFGNLRPQLRFEVISTKQDTPGSGRVFGELEVQSGSPTVFADMSDNLMLAPPGSGTPAATEWVVEPPEGNIEGGTNVQLYSRAVGTHGTLPRVSVTGLTSISADVGWLSFTNIEAELVNFPTIPTVGTVFTCTRLV